MNAKTLGCIDVCQVPPPQRHPLIFGTFDTLAPGRAFEIVNDHDPVPLYFQFEKTRLGQFDWRYLESGPARRHVRIARVATGLPPATAAAAAVIAAAAVAQGACGSSAS